MAVKGWRHRAPGAIIREHHHTRAETVPQSILDRLEALEKRPVEQVQSSPEPVPCQCQTFDPAPAVEEIATLRSAVSAKDAQLIKQERLLQAMVQFVDGLSERVDVIEQIDITLLDERKAG